MLASVTFMMCQVVLLINCYTFNSTIAEDLYNTMLSGYCKEIRPCFGCGKALVLNITFHLTSLNYLDEVHGEMNTVGYVSVNWIDSRLSWNPSDYQGIVTMLVPYSKIWSPKILLGNPSQRITDLNGGMTLPRVVYNGTVIWSPGEVFQTRCYPDIYRYPFDEQECYISFIPWGYLANEIVFHTPENDNPLPFYEDNGEWILKETFTQHFTENSMNLVKFFFRFRRRPQFFIVNVILPIILLGFLNCLVFLIPANSGERVSYSITVSLSFAVFMSIVGDNIPKTSAPMALLSYYLFSVFGMSALIMVCTIFNVNIFNRNPEIPISDKYKTFVMLINRQSKCDSKVAPERQKIITTMTIAEMDELKDNHEKVDDVPNKTVSSTWVDVSKCLDRFCLFGFLFLFVISTVGQFLYLYVSS